MSSEHREDWYEHQVYYHRHLGNSLDQGYPLIEYEKFDEAQAVIYGMEGIELLTQIILVDWASNNGPFKQMNTRKRIIEETEDTSMDQVNEIGYKIAIGGWFVSEGELILLAHDDGSCSFYDIANTEQNNTIRYVNNAIKEGTGVSIFCKESMGEDGKGTAYWYDGDSTIGHRLYKEITKVEFVKMKGKGRLTQPTNSYQWETLATNLEELKQIFLSTHVAREEAWAKVSALELD
ncbi:hypothetical protein GIB67_006857 [Kingdonia uniflora]|uniref:Uncharacterized protein n=1 Tax=Kingdonia uniflora TaxID=39325 RepID=A0A7J7L018_9MAGN|nr:hypothetical protein GIB67_006857 [Kingdonia uniflora]